jgi:hypothetical protein
MTKKREKPFHLDMSFDEALRRVVQTDPHQLYAQKSVKVKQKQRGPAARRKVPAKGVKGPPD